MGSEEVNAFLTHLAVEAQVSASTHEVGLLYGSGLRLLEALRLRVQDLDFERRELTVRWRESTAMPRGNGAGNGCCPNETAGSTPLPG